MPRQGGHRLMRKRERNTTSAPKRQPSRVPQKACHSDGQLRAADPELEIIRDPADPGRIITLDAGRDVLTPTRAAGSTAIDARFVRALALPTRVAAFGSIRTLFKGIKDAFEVYFDLPD